MDEAAGAELWLISANRWFREETPPPTFTPPPLAKADICTASSSKSSKKIQMDKSMKRENELLLALLSPLKN